MTSLDFKPYEDLFGLFYYVKTRYFVRTWFENLFFPALPKSEKTKIAALGSGFASREKMERPVC